MEIKNTEVYGLEESIIRSGFPMMVGTIKDKEEHDFANVLTEGGVTRAGNLGRCKPGSGHDNFLKGIIVQFDIKYPQYFTPQLQRYNWIDIISSQSKMHRLTSNQLSEDNCSKWVLPDIAGFVNCLIEFYNNDNLVYPFTYLNLDVSCKYDLFMTIVSNLPMGYEMWMGVSTNYLQLKTIYNQRKNHKLKDDWGYFCKWVEELPFFRELVLGE